MQAVLPIIAAAIVVALLSGQYRRTPKRDRSGSGYVLSYPKLDSVLALTTALMVGAFTGIAIYCAALAQILLALFSTMLALGFGVAAYVMFKRAFTRITVNDSGLELRTLGRRVYVPWGEATVDALTRIQSVIFKNDAGQEINVSESMTGAAIIEEYVRKHVAPARVRFIRNIAGEHQLFYREPSKASSNKPDKTEPNS
jgi:hypothetical protein